MRLFAIILVIGCGMAHSAAYDAATDTPSSLIESKIDSPPGASLRTIVVIPMEHEPSSAIYGVTTYTPYINGQMTQAAHTTKFGDELPALPSEPHYVCMEGGTNVFSGRTFTTDNNPSSSNSTSSKEHLVTQLETKGLSWMSYQEDITDGTCPTGGVGEYAPKHDPMVFYQDVVGSPPSSSNAHCI